MGDEGPDVEIFAEVVDIAGENIFGGVDFGAGEFFGIGAFSARFGAVETDGVLVVADFKAIGFEHLVELDIEVIDEPASALAGVGVIEFVEEIDVGDDALLEFPSAHDLGFDGVVVDVVIEDDVDLAWVKFLGLGVGEGDESGVAMLADFDESGVVGPGVGEIFNGGFPEADAAIEWALIEDWARGVFVGVGADWFWFDGLNGLTMHAN